eukprot:3546547-Amphidinium_carterae.1
MAFPAFPYVAHIRRNRGKVRATTHFIAFVNVLAKLLWIWGRRHLALEECLRQNSQSTSRSAFLTLHEHSSA